MLARRMGSMCRREVNMEMIKGVCSELRLKLSAAALLCEISMIGARRLKVSFEGVNE